MGKSITLTDHDIVEFYNNNPHLNPTDINRTFIEILKSLSTDLSKTLENTKLGRLKTSINTLKEEVQNMKQEQIDVMKEAFNTFTLENTDKLNSVVERNTSMLIDRTTNILNDIIPRNQNENQKKVESIVREFHNSISADTKKLLETNTRDDETLKSLIDGMDNKFSNMSIQLQQPLINFMKASEERMRGDFDKVKETSLFQAKEQEKMSAEIMEFLNKYKHSGNAKGSVSENMLYSALQNVFPSDEIIDCRSETASGDFIVNRKDTKLPSIIVENKDYARQVETREVVKFERDIQQRKCHGIFLSQSSGITFKDPFHIDIIEGLIHVYVPNVKFSIEKIKIAADIIDNLAPALSFAEENYGQDDVVLSNAEIELLSDEYKKWGEKRNQTLELMKNAITNVEGMKLPSVQSILISAGKMNATMSLMCPCCKNYMGKSKQSLAAHMRKCKLNPKSSTFEGQNSVLPLSGSPDTTIQPLEEVELEV
jgi:hypothetical protein